MKTCELKFHPVAKNEWYELDAEVRRQMKKKLGERLKNPHVKSARLRDMPGCFYKIKLKTVGYRLVYEVVGEDAEIVVWAIGKRERNQAYLSAKRRTDSVG
ncbi:type II toxin-antitoxin system RelE family toxin [Burkholderia gladioli]|uniref:type II toxin-antitoxin system RelE family toxin n=1 Tax=Burkholderia gladioli TaxID=28095 RepID=UPI0016400C85|nr:type II toxin-antitoxin system RelE/ParE family toxin [Burkholderia gladioli]